MDKYDEIAERILDQTCGDNGKMHDGKVSHTRIAGILREAFTEPNPDYCRECGAPAGLHNAGCAARRPSAEPFCPECGIKLPGHFYTCSKAPWGKDGES